MSNQPTIPINTYCYITIFVCHYDSLAAAKERYQERLFTTTRCGYDIVFASEQVLDLGHVDYMFESLLGELIGFDEPHPKPKRKTTQPSLSPQSSTFPNAAKAALMIFGFM